MKLTQEKKQKNINIEEFRALVNNLIPTTLKQAEWVWSEMERLIQEYPELKEKFKEFHTMSEFERRELAKIIQEIIADEDKTPQKWRISQKGC